LPQEGQNKKARRSELFSFTAQGTCLKPMLSAWCRRPGDPLTHAICVVPSAETVALRAAYRNVRSAGWRIPEKGRVCGAFN
jgi:hypothetical protein